MSMALAWNVFQFCTPLRALGSIMILLVLAIVGLSYYSLVLVYYGPALLRGGFHFHTLIALGVLLLFHALLVMLLWSYFSVVVMDPGGIPSNWRPVLDEEKGDVDALVGLDHSSPGLEPDKSTMPTDPSDQRMLFCRKCNHFKPPRCHHCSVCGRCILKMDHHCVWVVNCVGALNYKFFLLFLFYTFLETTLVTLSLLPYFVALFTDGEVTGTPSTLAAIFITFILNLTFALSVLGFLITHISLVAANTTTIEAYEKKASSKWHFDIGRKRNFEQVFGMDKKYWFIPAHSEEDLKRMPALHGLEYPTKFDLNLRQQL